MSIPTSGFVAGIGTVRILGVYGDYFSVLDNRDKRRHIHRSRIVFRSERPESYRSITVGQYACGTQVEMKYNLADLVSRHVGPRTTEGE